MRIKLNDKIFDVRVASTDEELQVGLSQDTKLSKLEGLLLKFPNAADHSIRMSDMSFDLDLVFINDGRVIKVLPAKAGVDDLSIGEASTAVLELKSGAATGIAAGVTVEILGTKNDDGSVSLAEGGIAVIGERQVLDEDGKNQMNLIGGERIFARSVSEKLFKYAKSSEFKKLGKVMVDDINKQDTQEPEYADN